tara:strand:+ start:25585 stop:26079 length:495 start_codon:yes stop_codon:yes gene_type:complete
MTNRIDSPFWYFNKNLEKDFTLELRGLLTTPIRTNIKVDKITRLQAEFCSELEIELIHALKPIANDFTFVKDIDNDDMGPYAYIAQVLGATRYEPPLMLNGGHHFDHVVLGELYIGNVIEVDINKVDVKLFITGIFDDSLQAVILSEQNSNVFKPFQNLYVRDV